MKKLACMALAIGVLVAADLALCNGAWGEPAIVADAAAGAPSGQDPAQQLPGKETTLEHERELIRQRIVLNMDRLKRCVAATAKCTENEIPRLLLGLTHAEIEGILGPPQYELRLAGNHVYYWTVPLASNRPQGAVRVQVSFGDCYYRQKDSKEQAVCDASIP